MSVHRARSFFAAPLFASLSARSLPMTFEWLGVHLTSIVRRWSPSRKIIALILAFSAHTCPAEDDGWKIRSTAALLLEKTCTYKRLRSNGLSSAVKMHS